MFFSIFLDIKSIMFALHTQVSTPNCLAEGLGLFGCQVHVPTTVRLLLRDAFNQPVTCLPLYGILINTIDSKNCIFETLAVVFVCSPPFNSNHGDTRRLYQVDDCPTRAISRRVPHHVLRYHPGPTQFKD
jgi:hypothetical protein